MGISGAAKFTKILLRVHFWRLLRHSYQDQRKIQANFNRRTAFIPKGITIQAARAGGIPVEWVSGPGRCPDAVTLYFHGGAYFTGSVVTHREFAARMALATGTRLVTVDYRLAPEHPYPAALEDAVGAYRWLLAEGHDPAKIIMAGDSAGGGLTLAALLSLRDAGEPLPAGAFCYSPWVDLTLSGASMQRNAQVEIMCKPDFLNEAAQLYTQEYDRQLPLISPLFADLRGLPPLLIIAGTEETLLDDATRFAARAEAAGIDTTLKIWPDMFHIFPIAGYLPEAKAALKVVGEFVQGRMNC